MDNIKNSTVEFTSQEDISTLKEIKKAIDIIVEQEEFLNKNGIEIIIKSKDA